MVEIKDLTIICVDTKNYGRAVHALKKCQEQVKVDRTVLLTDIDLNIQGIEIIKIDPIHSKKQYSRFIIKELYKYFDTSHCLIVQWDGYILDGDCWNPEFMEMDYIGAPWLYQDGRNVGNGGFSIRSHRLQTILATNDFIEVSDPEDEVICRTYGNWLQNVHGIKFATQELADTFSFELRTPICKTFGFHGWFHKPYQETIIIKRTAALGDCVQCEPILAHFYKKGYRVVLDTLPQFHNLFIQHYFKVHRLEEVDHRLLTTTKRYDLDFSYESKPKQLHLKTYFEFCEVPESEMILRNPILHLNIPKEKGTKLFKKYCVLHLATRGQASRNIQGDIDWERLVDYLNHNGYTVIQIGGSPQEDVKGAIQMMTPGEPFLMWVIREADLMISIDSGPSNVAVSFNVPSIIFVGSVDLRYIYYDLSNICVIEKNQNCGNEKCWHNIVGCEGMECIVNEKTPPCVDFNHEDVMFKINEFIEKINR